MPLSARRGLLESLTRSVAANSADWVRVAATYKGLAPGSPLVGEEWISGPYAMLTTAAALTESLRALERGGSPVDGFRMGTAPGGRVAVNVLPHGVFDQLLLSGFSVQVWMQPGVSAATGPRPGRASGSSTRPQSGGVGVVLGAGNITADPPARRAVRAVRAQQGGGAEAQPGDRTAAAGAAQGLRAADRRRAAADRHGRRGRRPVSGAPPVWSITCT